LNGTKRVPRKGVNIVIEDTRKHLAPAVTEAKCKKKCVCCKKYRGELQLEDGNWICENCAQIMNDLAP
jgi:hypothetical protein